LKKTLVFRPSFEQAYYDLAAAQLAADRAGDASDTLRSAKSRFPTRFITEFLMALASQHLKNYADAITHFTAAEIIAKAGDPKSLNANFYFQAAIANERSGNREQAAKLFEKSLELQPDFPEAQNYLGYMWAEKGENLDRAKELIEKALKAEPKSAAYLDSMGWVLFKLNQPQPALEYLLKAVELNEEPDATLYDHLGDIYAALNETGKAREAWQKSLGVEANDEVKKKLDVPKTP
jgi:tetratricopeptide (TPR) repeat protein